MNSQFSQRVSDVLTYSKEEANRLRNSLIGPEHLLLGILRDGSGKAMEVLMKLDADVNQIKRNLEENMEAEDDLLPEAEIPLSLTATRILKICILEARLLKSEQADTEHLLLAILKDGNNMAATVLMDNGITYQDVYDVLTMKSANPNAGMGFTEDDDDEEDVAPSRSGQEGSRGGMGSSSASAQTATRRPANDTPVLDNRPLRHRRLRAALPTIRPCSTISVPTSPVPPSKASWTPLWAANARLSAWHRS